MRTVTVTVTVAGTVLTVLALGGLAAADDRGDIDHALLEKQFEQHRSEIRVCYEHELVAAPKLAGHVVLTFTIARSGKVSEASADGLNPAMAACLAGVAKHFTFPASTADARIAYPLSFVPG